MLFDARVSANLTNMLRILRLLLLILFIVFPKTFGQKYVMDSVTIRFGMHQIPPASVFVDTVIDNRDELKGNQVRISEKTRYLFIPVDRYFVTEKALVENVHSLFTDQKRDTSYKFIIDEFEISHRKGLVNGTLLSAKIRVFEGATGETKQLKGTLLYQTKGQKPKKRNLSNNYEQLINTWQYGFLKDIYRIKSDTSLYRHTFDFYNYRPLVEKVPTRLYCSSFAAIGLDWWIADLEFGFYEPEVSRKFLHHTGYIRYRWTKQFESLAIGKDATHFCYRLGPYWVIEAVPQVSLGFNSWKDWENNSHDLYDLFSINGSLREVIRFNPMDRRCVSFTFGFIQDVYYIHSIDWNFKPGIIFGLGFNF